jgi:hypothetical protein
MKLLGTIAITVALSLATPVSATIFSKRNEAIRAQVAADLEAKEAIRRQDRERFAALRTSGGTFYKRGSKPYPVCKTKDDYAQYMGFLIGRYSNLPADGQCWELSNDTEVEFVPFADLDEHCNPVNGVCQFKYSYFGKIRPTFWTSIHSITPND